MSCDTSLFPVCCYTCRKVINPHYETFRVRVREIQAMEGVDAETKQDMVAGVLSSLGIHRMCCRIMFISYVDNHTDDLATRGEQYVSKVYAHTAGEISGTVTIIRTPLVGGKAGPRAKPTVLLAR